jgi:hypothetical protein
MRFSKITDLYQHGRQAAQAMLLTIWADLEMFDRDPAAVAQPI